MIVAVDAQSDLGDAKVAFAEAAIAHAQVVMAEGDVAEIVRATKALLLCRRAMMAMIPAPGGSLTT
jgi:hypothetical protein